MAAIDVTGDVLQEAARLQMSRILSLTAGNPKGADRFLELMRQLALDAGVDPEVLEKRATDCVAVQFLS